MRLTRSVLLAFGLLFAAVPLRADEPVASDAARYIRALFDATLQEDGLSRRCDGLEAFGRFVAGRAMASAV